MVTVVVGINVKEKAIAHQCERMIGRVGNMKHCTVVNTFMFTQEAWLAYSA